MKDLKKLLIIQLDLATKKEYLHYHLNHISIQPLILFNIDSYSVLSILLL